MSRIYYHNYQASPHTKEVISEIVDVLETYLCNYKLAFHCRYKRCGGKNRLTRLDINELGHKSIIGVYSFEFDTLTRLYRKQFDGCISLQQIREELGERGF